jgi:hypothetical protein
MSETSVDKRTDAWQQHFDWPVWLQQVPSIRSAGAYSKQIQRQTA